MPRRVPSSNFPSQDEELGARAAKITQLGIQVASEGRQRAEERRGRTEAERRLRAEKQVIACPYPAPTLIMSHSRRKCMNR